MGDQSQKVVHLARYNRIRLIKSGLEKNITSGRGGGYSTSRGKEERSKAGDLRMMAS